MLKELQDKRAILVKELEEFRNKRNKLNTESSTWSSQRNELNRTSKMLMDEAQHYKHERDEYNKKVSESKTGRDYYNKKINETNAKISKIKKECNITGTPVEELKHTIDELEFKQQTQVLSSDKEKGLVTQINALVAEYKAKKDAIEKNTELKQALEELGDIREKASGCHETVTEYADMAQEYHDKMISAFKEGETIRSRSDRIHKKFVKIQDEADDQHHLFIKAQKEIRELDRLINSISKRGREDKRKVERIKAKKEAEVIYDLFRHGEKISTEDLMLLQRSDLL
ncbi:MAG: phosphoserine phosphatase [Methanosarcinales archaeon]|nr:MAG: phosphoserine phosphatase [Methanosarcinales archaeon]